MRKILISVFAVPMALVVTAPTASAASPANPYCWGGVTSQRASTLHDVGAHVSAQSEPRTGLGNVAREVFGQDGHVSDLGSFLASVDGIEATSCP